MNWISKLTLSILICHVPGLIGGVYTAAGIRTWYSGLSKPWFNPPNWIFGPVWLTLYTMMGVSLFMVWAKLPDNVLARKAIFIFAAQLVLNALWSPVFFGLRSTAAGLAVIVLLWVFILITILSFYPISVPASLILVPYLLWVTFAVFLNASILLLNR
jgi:tryptophan-rich sensory protein